MDTLKYIVKRLLMAVLILFGVSIIIYSLSRMMPTDYVDNQYSSSVSNGTMTQEDVDRIKEIYGLNMPDAYLNVVIQGKEHEYGGKSFTKNTKEDTYERVQDGVISYEEWYSGSYDWSDYRIYLDVEKDDSGKILKDENGRAIPTTYRLYEVHARGWKKDEVETDPDETPGEEETPSEEEDNTVITLDEELILIEQGAYTVNDDHSITLTVMKDGVATGATYSAKAVYRVASFWDKAGSVLGNYFVWL
ncbi:MAG: hypothetical protein K2H43_03080, partial [Clostridia bacterium]|nr:hypothetical protein [Clostridia bacterium]